MLEFVKALSHADRLRVIGVLAHKPASAKEISESLGMPLQDVIQHLATLSEGGVVVERAQAWEIDAKNMEALTRRQFEGSRPSYQPAPDLSDRSRKVLAACLSADGTIRQLPPQ